jgi:hypothetical protein
MKKSDRMVAAPRMTEHRQAANVDAFNDGVIGIDTTTPSAAGRSGCQEEARRARTFFLTSQLFLPS